MTDIERRDRWTDPTKTLRERSFTLSHITGEKRPVVFLHAAEAEVESLRQQLQGAVAKVEAVERLCSTSLTGMVAVSALRDAMASAGKTRA